MKGFLLSLVFLPLLAFAKPVSFDFNAVSLVAFSQATFRGIMGRDFVISPDVLAADRRITINVKNIDQAEIPAFVTGILKQQGISVTERGGVYYLDQASRVQPAQEGQQTAQELAQAMYGMPLSPREAAPSLARSSEPVQDRPAFGRAPDDESTVYVPKNRPSDFLASILNAGFGGRAAHVAGSRLVLSGAASDVKKMIALLDSVDVLPSRLDVSASWVEVARTDGVSRGFSLIANVLGTKLGISLGSVNSGSVISLRNTNFELVVDALNTDARFKQISNSRLVADEYEPVRLIVGDETPTVSSTGKDNSGNQVQNVVYRPSGVIVDVVPKVLASGRINMTIDGQISNFKATQTGVNGSPTLIKRQVKTAVTVGDGEVLLIGGLNDTNSTESSSGLPFLPARWSLTSGSRVQTDLVLVLSAKAIPTE